MKQTTNLIIIDASGSMEDKKQEVVNNLRELLTQIRLDAERDINEVTTSTVVLDFSAPNDIRELVNSGNSALLQEDLASSYKTRGSTALYDAIGRGFSLVPEDQNNVFVSILTDGQENASREFSFDKIKKMIGDKKKAGWMITFMGTTEDAIENAVAMGVSRGSTMSFMNSADGYNTAGHTLSNARSMSYSANTKGRVGGQSVSMDMMENLMELAQDETLATATFADLQTDDTKKQKEAKPDKNLKKALEKKKS
jgi:hypothetical protein